MSTVTELLERDEKDNREFDAGIDAHSADVVEIDANGDLHLSIGPDHDLFLVCSRTLSRSSRYWKNVLYGPFANTKPSSPITKLWLKDLPDDSPTALHLILALIHRPFEPPTDLRAIKLDVLHDIASAIERYEWGHLLRMHGWSKEVVRRLNYVNRPMVVQLAHSQVPIPLFDDVLKGLWVAWAVGSASHFGQFAAAIARQVTADQEGKLTHPHTGELLEDRGLVPNEEMLEAVRVAHAGVLRVIREHLTNTSKIDFLIVHQGLCELLHDHPQCSLDQIWLKFTVGIPSLGDGEDIAKVLENVKVACRHVQVINKRHEESLVEQGRKTGIVKPVTNK